MSAQGGGGGEQNPCPQKNCKFFGEGKYFLVFYENKVYMKKKNLLFAYVRLGISYKGGGDAIADMSANGGSNSEPSVLAYYNCALTI